MVSHRSYVAANGDRTEDADVATFRSVKRRHLRRPARWRASCTACDSSIVVVGTAEEDGAASWRERLRGAICFERFGFPANGENRHGHTAIVARVFVRRRRAARFCGPGFRHRRGLRSAGSATASLRRGIVAFTDWEGRGSRYLTCVNHSIASEMRSLRQLGRNKVNSYCSTRSSALVLAATIVRVRDGMFSAVRHATYCTLHAMLHGVGLVHTVVDPVRYRIREGRRSGGLP